MAVDIVDAEIGKDLRRLVERIVALGVDYRNASAEWRREWLRAEMNRSLGNQCAAARHMGVHRNTVRSGLLRTGLAIKTRGLRCGPRANVFAFRNVNISSP